MHASENHLALRDRTTLRLGGKPSRWHTVRTLDALAAVLEQNDATPLLVLGGGSNLVCSDDPFPGTVVELELSGVHAESQPPTLSIAPRSSTALSLSAPNVELSAPSLPKGVDPNAPYVWLHVAAGERWDEVVAAACRWGLAGIECLSGIPGKAGATPIQNVGAYGQEVGDTLWSVTCMERKTRALVVFSAAHCELGYRTSRFKTTDLDRYVVVEVVFRLRVGGPDAIRYGELAHKLSTIVRPLSLPQVRAAVLETRAAKSMLLDPTDPNGRNCGSFFLNPIVQRAQLAQLQSQSSESIPAFEVDATRVKVPAAWLIERAGFARGHRVGNVGLSTKHTLCLVAYDNAKASELLGLAQHIRDAVRNKFGIELHPEPVLVGLRW